MSACSTCQGLESLIRRHDVEQVLIRGRNEHGTITWIADVITPDADGHRSAATLDEAMNAAIGEAIETKEEHD